jgi:uncharacterized protein
LRFFRKRKILVSLAVLALLAAALAVWSFLIEPDRLVVNEVPLQLQGWPRSFNNLKIAVLGDLHVGSPHIGIEKLQEIVRAVNERNPDVVLIPGDLVIQDVVGGHFVAPETIAENLRGLRARFGVYAVLGNHDRWLDGERVRRALEAAGVRVLENDVARLDAEGESFWVGGLSDLWTGKPDVKGTLLKVSDDAPVILFTHNPDLFPEIPGRVILTVAAHTHGGQVNLPFIGRPVVPSRYKQRFAAGHIIENGRHLYVTTGIGTSIIPVRFRVVPEITMLIISGPP